MTSPIVRLYITIYTQGADSLKCSKPMPKVVVGVPRVLKVFSWVFIWHGLRSGFIFATMRFSPGRSHFWGKLLLPYYLQHTLRVNLPTPYFLPLGVAGQDPLESEGCCWLKHYLGTLVYVYGLTLHKEVIWVTWHEKGVTTSAANFFGAIKLPWLVKLFAVCS